MPVSLSSRRTVARSRPLSFALSPPAPTERECKGGRARCSAATHTRNTHRPQKSSGAGAKLRGGRRLARSSSPAAPAPFVWCLRLSCAFCGGGGAPQLHATRLCAAGCRTGPRRCHADGRYLACAADSALSQVRLCSVLLAQERAADCVHSANICLHLSRGCTLCTPSTPTPEPSPDATSNSPHGHH